MSYTRRKKDANHDAVVDVWRKLGWTVIETHMVGALVPGFPDAVCIRFARVLLMEIKAGRKATLTPAEKLFAALVGSPPYVVCRSVEDATKQAIEWRAG